MFAIVIPAYQPDKKLISMLENVLVELEKEKYEIVLIDDGSGAKYDNIFQTAESMGIRVIRYLINAGKGYALKTAFQYLIKEHSSNLDGIGADWIITVDADGQHTIEDIEKIIERSRVTDKKLIVGSRSFVGYVPVRSRIGNLFAALLFKGCTGIQAKDTQSGLRAYKGTELCSFAEVEGNRYEYEMNCLIQYQNDIDYVDIETVYELGNRSSHYRPFADSMKIFKALIKAMLKN